MKKLLFIPALLFFATFMMGQTKSIGDFIKTYTGGDDITTVYISPSMLSMMKQEAKDESVTGDEFKEMISNFKGLNLMVAESNAAAYLTKFQEQIKLDDYEELMLVNSDGEFVQMVAKMNSNDMIEDFVMVVLSDEEFVLMNFQGLFNLNTLQSLGNIFDIDIDLDQID